MWEIHTQPQQSGTFTSCWSPFAGHHCYWLVIIGGNLSAERYWDEILQPVAIPCLYSLGPNSILQDDNAHPHRRVFLRIWEWRGWNGLPADLTPLNTYGISLGMLFMLEWPPHPHWLTCDKCLNTIPWQYVTRLVTSIRWRCQTVVAVYGSSTTYWGSCLLLLNYWIVKLPICLFLRL